MTGGGDDRQTRGWAPLEPPPPPSMPAPAPPPPGPYGAPPRPAPPYPPHPPYPPYPPYGPPPQPKGGTARTGPLPLHPMTLSDVIDGAFKLLKANARTVILIVAAITVPLQLLTAFVARDAFQVGLLDVVNDPTLAETVESEPSNAQLIGQLIAVLIALLVTPFIAGAISRVVSASYLGQEIGPGAALKVAGRRFGALLGSWVLVHLLQFSPLILVIPVAIVASPLLVIPAMLALVVTVPLFSGFYTLVAPAIAVEEIGPIKGMRRSWRLVRPRFWQVLGIGMLAGVISNVLGQLLSTIPTIFAVFVGGSWAWLVIAIFSSLAAIVSTPIVTIVATLLYFDARIRHEGFDLQMMAASLQRG